MKAVDEAMKWATENPTLLERLYAARAGADQTAVQPEMTSLPVRNGVAWIWAAWSLKPNQATIVALCTSEYIAERYRTIVEGEGGVFHAEEAPVDHMFAGSEPREVAWRAATKWSKARRELVQSPRGDITASPGDV